MTSRSLHIPLAYLRWHFTTAWADLFRLYINVAWFLFNLFSIKILLQTLFAPWKRLRQARGDKDSAGIVGKLILNTLMRVVGFIARVSTIGAGLFILLIFTISFILFAVLWPILPLIALGLVVKGIMAFFP